MDRFTRLVTLQAMERLLQRVLARGVKRSSQVAINRAIAQLDRDVTILRASIGRG